MKVLATLATAVLLLVGISSVLSVPGQDPTDGNSLARVLWAIDHESSGLTAAQKLDYLAGTSYLTGFLDACCIAQQVKVDQGFKLPNGISVLQFAKLVEKYLNQHPERLHLTARELCYMALRDSFPNP